MQKIFCSLKKKDGSASFEIIIWFSILSIILTMSFLLLPSIFRKSADISEQTIVSSQEINQDNLASNNVNTKESIEPIVQNVTINNIVKDKNTSFWSDFNMNVLSDFTATILVGTLSFFAGIFMKNRHSTKIKQLDKE